MNSIDERVVKMRFDNQQFESGVSTTMSSLQKLKASLGFKNKNPFDDLSKSANNVKLSGIQAGVQALQNRFSTLGIISMAVISRITNAALTMGKNVAASLTIRPMMQGFNEYELKINSMRTIMASTGASVGEVSKYLNELNHYADRTIYSFSDMTANIGKFTNAGVKLPVAVKAIQGISNAAALSGSTAEEASHAMYNFAQALSSGYVKLIDWKSIEVANMATVEFKQQLIDTAVQCGTLRKEANGMYTVLSKNGQGGTMKETISATKNFNDSLQYQWMTTEVLTKTLGNYSNETTAIGKKAFAAAENINTFSQLTSTVAESVGSSWAETFELLFGDIETARKFWTGLYKAISSVIDPINDARNASLRFWVAHQGRDKMIASLARIFKYFGDIAKVVGQELGRMFPGNFGQALVNMSNGFDSFTKNLKFTKGRATALRGILRPLVNLFLSLGEAISKTTGMLKNAIGTQLGKLGNFFKPVSSKAEKAVIQMGKLDDTATKAAHAFLGYDKGVNSLSHLGRQAGIAGMAFGKLGIEASKLSIIDRIFIAVGKNIQKVSTAIHNFFNPLDVAASKASKSFGFFDKTTVGVQNDLMGLSDEGAKMSTLAYGVAKVSTSFGKFASQSKGIYAVKDWLKNFGSNAKTAFQSAAQSAGSYFKTLSDKYYILDKVRAITTGVAAGFKNFGKILQNLKMEILGKIVGEEFTNKLTFAGIQTKVCAAAAKVLEAAMSGLSKILDAVRNALIRLGFDIKDPIGNFKTLGTSCAEAVKGMSLFQKASSRMNFASLGASLKNAGENMKNFGGKAAGAAFDALGIHVNNSVKSIGGFKGAWQSLKDALRPSEIANKFASAFAVIKKVLAAIGNAIVVVAKVVWKNHRELMKIAKTAGMTAALFSLSKMLKNVGGGIGEFFEQLSKSVQAVRTGGLKAIILGIKDASDESKKIDAKAFLRIGLAVAALTISIKTLSKLNAKESAKALTILAGALGIVAASMKIMTKVVDNSDSTAKDIAKLCLGILAISYAMKSFSKAIQILGGMKWDQLARGAGVFAGLMMMVSLFAYTIEKSHSSESLKKAANSMVTFATGLLIMSFAIKILGNMPWDSLARGSGVLAGLIMMVSLFSSSLERSGGANSFKTAAGGMIALGIGMIALSIAIKILGSMDLYSLAKGLGTVVAAVAAFAVVASKMKGAGGDFAKFSLGVIALGLGLLALAGAIKIFSMIGFDTILNGLVKMVIILASLGGIAKLVNGSGSSFLRFGVAIVAVALGMAVLTQVVKSLANLSMDKFMSGLSKMIAILAAFVFACYALKPVQEVLLVVAGAFAIFGIAVVLIGIGISIAARGLASLAKGIALLAAQGDNIDKVSGAMTRFIILIAAMALLSPGVMLFAAGILLLSVSTIIAGIGLGMIANSISNLVAASAGLMGILPGLALLAVALVALGVAGLVAIVAAIGIGILALALMLLGVALTLVANGLLRLMMVFGIIGGAAGGFANTIKNAFTSAFNFFASLPGRFINAAKSIVGGIWNGIKSGVGKAGAAMKSVGTAVWNAIKGLPGHMLSAGKNAIQGFVNGLSPGKLVMAAVNKVRSLGTKVLNAIQHVLGIRSPSREFLWAAQMCVVGLGNGFAKYGKYATGRVSKFGRNVFDAIHDSLQNVSSDMTPTITPVLDLSNIQNGANSIGSMLGDTVIGTGLTASIQAAGGVAANASAGNVSLSNLESIVKTIAANQSKYSGEKPEIHVHAAPGQSAKDIANEVFDIFISNEARKAEM